MALVTKTVIRRWRPKAEARDGPGTHRSGYRLVYDDQSMALVEIAAFNTGYRDGDFDVEIDNALIADLKVRANVEVKRDTRGLGIVVAEKTGRRGQAYLDFGVRVRPRPPKRAAAPGARDG